MAEAKQTVWLKCGVKTPPFSTTARLEAGFLLRKLQEGKILSLPASRPMPDIGLHCHELRIKDAEKNWRIMYRVDTDAVVIMHVFNKTTRKTPPSVIDICQKRLKQYDEV